MPRYWWFAERVGPPSRNREFFRGVDFVMGAAGSWQMSVAFDPNLTHLFTRKVLAEARD
jgi:hypothetical protein